MPKKDPRLDAYIAKSAPFAQPILKQLRKVVHAGCPEVEETLKWSMPHFDYKGPLCGMAAFKRHGSFGFWKAALILPVDLGIERKGMGQFGPITTLSDLPTEEILVGYVRKAVELNEAGCEDTTASKTQNEASGHSRLLPKCAAPECEGEANLRWFDLQPPEGICGVAYRSKT